MAIFIDNARIKRRVGRFSSARWSHLVAIPANHDELLDFAMQIGLSPEWLQTWSNGVEHFDITEPKRKQAIAAGARSVSTRELALFIADPRLTSLTRPAEAPE